MNVSPIVPSMGCGKYDSDDLDRADSSDTMSQFNQFVLPYIQHTKRWDMALDVGCGNGRISNVLSKYFKHVIALDPFREPNQVLMQPNIEFQQTSYQNFCQDNIALKFDLIVFWTTFYIFHPTYKQDFQCAIDMLNRDGLIIICENREHLVRSEETRQYYYPLHLLTESATDIRVVAWIASSDPYSICIIQKVK